MIEVKLVSSAYLRIGNGSDNVLGLSCYLNSDILGKSYVTKSCGCSKNYGLCIVSESEGNLLAVCAYNCVCVVRYPSNSNAGIYLTYGNEVYVAVGSLQSKGLSRVFSNTTVQKHQFFSAQLYL